MQGSSRWASTLSISARQRFAKYFQQADTFEHDSSQISSDLEKLSTDFENFAAKFQAWGKSKEDAIDETILKLEKDISDLNLRINELNRKGEQAATITAGVSIMLGCICIFAPYAAPLVAVGTRESVRKCQADSMLRSP